MATQRKASAPGRSGENARPQGREIDLLGLAASIALALWVFRGVPGHFFSPDDLIYLERAAGLAPHPPGLWRWLSGRAYVGLAFGAFAANPAPYMLVNLAVHALNVGLLYVLVRRWGAGPLGAFVAAGWFASSRLFLTAIGQMVTLADLLALTGALVALRLAMLRGRLGLALAALASGGAVLAKESVVLLPLLLLAPWPEGPSALGRARRAAIVLLPAAVVTAIALWPGATATIFGAAYERAYGLHLLSSLGAYSDWAVDMHSIVPDLFSGVEKLRLSTGVVALVAAILLAVLAWRVSALPMVGLAWWILGLAPVLPFLYHRYTYYLYAALPGLAIVAGASLDLLARWRPAGRSHRPAAALMRAAAVLVAVLLVLWHAQRSEALVRERAVTLIGESGLAMDPFYRKQQIAREVVERIRPAASRPHARLLFLAPDVPVQGLLLDVVSSVLDRGRGLRPLFPTLDSAVFTPRWAPRYRAYEIFIAEPRGRVEPLGSGPDALARAAGIFAANGWSGEAQATLDSALVGYPGHPELRRSLKSLTPPRGRENRRSWLWESSP